MKFKSCIFDEVRQTFSLAQNKKVRKPKLWLSAGIYSLSIYLLYYTELEKYEKEGLDSMDWAEWAGYEVYLDVVEKMTLEDWNYIKRTYQNKSENFKSLIANSIWLDEILIAHIKLDILIEMIMIEKIDVAYEAISQIVFRFVTSGEKHIEELKGVFLSEKKEYLIKKYFTKSFQNRVIQIANECGEFLKNGIYKFLEIIDKENTIPNKV